MASPTTSIPDAGWGAKPRSVSPPAAYWSWDAPFVHTARRYAAMKDASIIWEGHKAGREIGYCHMEKLHNLEILPATGFLVACFPVKIRRASAGWTRAVAILNG
jgi:kynurenine formamidase